MGLMLLDLGWSAWPPGARSYKDSACPLFREAARSFVVACTILLPLNKEGLTTLSKHRIKQFSLLFSKSTVSRESRLILTYEGRREFATLVIAA